jgi:hypothetical protein
MAGYIHDPLQIINLIADNLRDRYKSGFPVLKEIIQNADDAGKDAGLAIENIQLEFGLSQGIDDAAHPLLKGPALFFLNDGAFEDSDYKAIRSFGLNRKAIEQNSIGKFGLGMKSVFHFCEAFFFLAKNTNKRYAEILNPWSGGEEFSSFHDDWDNFPSSDVDLIRDHVQYVLNQMDLERDSFFLLWLPLRQKRHVLIDGTIDRSIISEFPGDNTDQLSFLFEQDLAQRIASLLPLLRRIISIRFWHPNGIGTEHELRFQVSMIGNNRIIGIADDQYQTRELEGEVHYQYSDTKGIAYALKYSGKELLLDPPELISLRHSQLWPKSYVRDDLGMSCEAPDKARGHSAVVFSRSNEKEQGRLKIRWAVFLPVGEDKVEKDREQEDHCGGNYCYRITLHGYFFIDAGRVAIEGLQEGLGEVDIETMPQNEAELRRLWNIRLARLGTLPLVLPALEAFVVKAKLSFEDTWHLSDGIRNSNLFIRHRKYICVNSFWGCILTPQGRKWGILPNDQEVLPLPGSPLSAPARPWQTLSNLESLQERGIVLLLRDAPHLLARPLPQWNETYLLEVLQLQESEVFSDQGCLDYLLQFLADSSIRPFLNMGSMQERLRHIANRAFVVLGIHLRQQRKMVQEFVSFILPANRYSIKADAPQVIRELQQCRTCALILAQDFDSAEAAGTAQLDVDDAFVLMKKLHDLIVHYEQQDNQVMIKHCRTIASDILQSQTEEQRRVLLVRGEKFNILEGYDCFKENPVALSPARVKECHDEHLLFLFSQGVNDIQRRGLAPKLQKAINKTVVLINSKTAEQVLGKYNGLLPCHAESALDSLGTSILPLQEIHNRRQLLPDVAGADLDSQVRVRGLRYLLHGLEGYFYETQTLWVSGYDQNPVWGKLWQQLESHNKDGWNLLDRTLVEEIPPNKWTKLLIREIKPDGILSELRASGFDRIHGGQLSREERQAVLKELDNDEDLWKKIPFHERVNGQLVSVTPGRTFLETYIVLPDELLKNADIIKQANDPVVKRQQKEWLIPLSEEGVIRIALKYWEPVTFWQLVLDNLGNAPNLFRSSLLRDIAWLPDDKLTPVKPSDVVYLEKMQDEVDRLLTVARGAFWSPTHLHADVQNHPSFTYLKQHSFAVDKEGFEKLELLLDETRDYHVGRVTYREENFEILVQIYAHLPVQFHLPGWSLLASALEISPEMAKELLLPQILQPIEAGRIIGILNWLQNEHIRVGIGKKESFFTAFNAYLSALVNANCGIDVISQLSLLNQAGEWKPAKELCSEAEGIDDSHLLDDAQKRLLWNVIVHADRQQAVKDENLPLRRDLQPEINASADRLESFFAEWEGLVAPEIVCAFLSLLGDDRKILALAERYRGNHHIEYIRNKIPWQVHRRTDNLHRQEWLYGLDQHQALAQHRFIVRCAEGDMVQTFSILGEEIEVPLKGRFSTLITGGLYYEYPDGQINNVRLTLRRPSLEDVTPSDLSGFLKASAEYLLRKAYNQRNCDLSQLWEELDRSEQLDIRIAEQLVLSHIPFYLRQLGVHKNPRLQELLNQWDETRYKREEYYELPEKKDAYDREERKILEKIQTLLKTDEEVQAVVLKAVRAKMTDFQYSVASIPFELFQNADDAVVELALIKAYPDDSDENEDALLPDHVKRFLIILQNDSLLFAHWGRPINSIGSAGFPGRERGFHHDLEKMLVLSSSDKSDEGKVTGKFGLGFKSVLLASERPRLISGRLATEIIAGLCPIPLQDSVNLRNKLHDLSRDRKWQGTLLELPLTDGAHSQIMETFFRLAGIMTIFSKKIHRIDIHGGNNQSWEWIPERILLSEGIYLELGELPTPKDHGQRRLAVYFKLHDGGLLFSLGPEGFRVLPAELPAIWVVAPTKETEGLGFAINCMFAVDAGRARLAGNSVVNQHKAFNLGKEFGQALRRLYALSQEKWDDVKTRFRLEADLSIYEFWATFWKIMAEGLVKKGSDEINNIVSHLLCDDNGLGYLISHEDAMPNGLTGSYQALTRPEKIRVVLKGSLESVFIFRELIEWEFFRKFLGNPESVISEAVYTVARKIHPAIGQNKNQWRSVQLADVLRNYAETEKNITPDSSTTLGRLINHDTLKREDFSKERENIEHTLLSLSFKTREGSFHSADEILVLQKHSKANPDEARRAAFAADDHVLSSEYQGTGLDFFFACREKISIPLEIMAEWLLDAPTDLRKSHGLRYLLEGEHGERLAQILRERGIEDTWLAELSPDSTCFQGWEQKDIFEILFRKLPSIDDLYRLHTEASDIPYALPVEELRNVDPKEILQRIHSWWMDKKEEYLAEYERRTYPDGVILDLVDDDVGRIDRKSWLILFCLGHFHTIGRQREVQHKGFIEKCLQKGWWEIFSKENPEKRSDEWMQVLEEYIAEQVDRSEYEFWMNRFPVYYKFSRWLEDYREVLLSINRIKSFTDIGGILKTRVNADFQGGGVSVPPIEKSLGIGACFILRELKRKQIVNGSQADPFCYVPVKRTRELCAEIGCRNLIEDGGIENSKVIHRFLCSNLGDKNADFCNCYDIPIQIMAEREDVLWTILH